MVTFKKDSFTIEVHTGTNPIEDWLELQKELIELMSYMNDDMLIKPWRTLNLLSETLPDWKTALKMTE